MPLFSVVVPAYNAAATLSETLDAVAAQSFGDWECIVVDDGSRDETRPIAEACATRDPRFRVIRQANQGSGGAYNTGVGAAVGDYVVLCSADDVLLPEHLARMAEFIAAEPGYDIYSANGFFWWSGDERQIVYPNDTRPILGDSVKSLTLADLIHMCFYGVGATYRRGLWLEIGGYRAEVFSEDYDFWLRAMARGATHRYTPEPLSLHRVSATQKSAAVADTYRSDIRLVSELRDTFELTPDESAAVDAAIGEREQLIGEVERIEGRGALRKAVVAVLSRLLGEHRLNRIVVGAKLRLGSWRGPER
jgi:glycosyltransferase involved in cell wall biosynthesis